MSDWNIVRKLVNSDGIRVIEISAGPDDLFRYQTSELVRTSEDERFFLGEQCWAYGDMSGYFNSVEDCEAYARQAVRLAHEEEFTAIAT